LTLWRFDDECDADTAAGTENRSAWDANPAQKMLDVGGLLVHHDSS